MTSGKMREEVRGNASPVGRLRILLGVLFVLGFSLFGRVDSFRAAQRNHEMMARSGMPDPVSRYLEKFRGAVNGLREYDMVGYVSDPADHAEYKARQYLAQRALAPTLIVDRADLPWVLGNFHTGIPPVVQEKGLVPVRDFGNGVVLYRGAAR